MVSLFHKQYLPSGLDELGFRDEVDDVVSEDGNESDSIYSTSRWPLPSPSGGIDRRQLDRLIALIATKELVDCFLTNIHQRGVEHGMAIQKYFDILKHVHASIKAEFEALQHSDPTNFGGKRRKFEFINQLRMDLRSGVLPTILDKDGRRTILSWDSVISNSGGQWSKNSKWI